MSKLLTRSQFGVYAALFASLIQLVASFGHVHSDHLRIQPVALESAPAVHPDGTRVSKPFDTDSDGPFADICDVCAMLNLIASGQVAAPPPLPTRIASCKSEMPVPTETMPAGMRHHRRFALSSASECRIEAAGKSASGRRRTLKSEPHKSVSDLKRQLASSSPLVSLGTMFLPKHRG